MRKLFLKTVHKMLKIAGGDFIFQVGCRQKEKHGGRAHARSSLFETDYSSSVNS